MHDESILEIKAEPLITPLMILALLLALWVIYVNFIGKQLRVRSRYILELAAQGVTETDAGFTPRPYPAGKLTYTRDEIDAFAAFLTKHLIAMRYREASG